MKKIYLSILFASFFIGISSCGDDEEITGPTPVVLFDQDRGFAEVGDEIQFTNNTTDGATYLWDFGDGNTSDQEAPKHTYTETGTFSVTLTAKGSGGRESSNTGTVIVGSRWLIGFDFIKIPLTKPDGSAWDEDESGPEVFFVAAETDATGSVTAFEIFTSLDNESQLPFNANLRGEAQFMFTDEEWDFVLFDNDEDLSDLNDNETIFGARGNPLDFGVVDPESGQGNLLLESDNGDTQINLRFQIRN